MGNLSGEFREQNRKDKVTRFRSVTYARQLGLLVNTLGSYLKYGPEPKKARLSSESRLQKQNHKQVSTVTHANFYHPVLFCKNLVLFDLPAWRTLRDCSPVRIR